MELDEILETERTIRKFEQIEVPEKSLDRILKNVRKVHCGNNKQLLRYVVVSSKKNKDIMGNLVHYAALLPKEIGEPKENEKAMAYVVITKPAEAAPIRDIDCGIAAEVICETAWDEGIGSCMMMNFNVKKVNELLELGEDRTARLVIALGYPKIHSQIVEAPENGDVKYYVDEQMNYYVPKLSIEKLSRKI